jgi:hypothetical protein
LDTSKGIELMARVIFAILTVVLAFAEAPSIGQVTFRTVVKTGEQVVGLPAGTTYSSYLGNAQPVINDFGNVAFAADFTGIGGNGAALLREVGEGGLKLIARTGDDVQGLADGITYDRFEAIRINNVENVAATARLRGPMLDNSNNVAIVREIDGEQLHVVARQGAQVPGLQNGISYSTLGYFQFNDLNQVAFQSHLAGAIYPRESVISVNDRIVATTGDHAAGLSNGASYSAFYSQSLNNRGDLSFSATLNGNPSDPYYTGLFKTSTNQGLTLSTVSGSPASNFPPGITQSVSIYSLDMNDAGESVFSSTLTGPGVNFTNSQALLTHNETDGARMVARASDQAYGFPPGVTYAGFGYAKINNASQKVLSGRLAGEGITYLNDLALFAQLNGSDITVIAREGDQPPGLPPGAAYSDLQYYTWQINDAGQIAYAATITSSGGTYTGIFATDLSGKVHLIAAEGQLLDVDDDPLVDDSRRVSDLLSFDFNNRGEVVFRAAFEGRSGIFVATVPVPEPATLSLLCFVGVLLARRPTKAY